MSTTRSLLVYDGDCGFCTSTARWIERRMLPDGACIAMWQSLDLDTLGLTVDQVNTAVYWVDPQGGTHRGERAVAQLLVDRGGIWALAGRILATPPVVQLAAVIYGLIAKNRYRLPGATDACRLPG